MICPKCAREYANIEIHCSTCVNEDNEPVLLQPHGGTPTPVKKSRGIQIGRPKTNKTDVPIEINTPDVPAQTITLVESVPVVESSFVEPPFVEPVPVVPSVPVVEPGRRLVDITTSNNVPVVPSVPVVEPVVESVPVVEPVKETTIVPSLSGMPPLAKGELSCFLKNQPTRKLYFSNKLRVSFGRAVDRADLRIAYEPYKPEAGYTDADIMFNKNNSIGLISGLHLEIWLEGDRVMIQDKGSTNGTSVNGEMLIPHHPIQLHNKAEIMPAPKVSRPDKALYFNVSILPDNAGVLLRQEYYKYREHLILWKRVALSPSPAGMIEIFNAQRHSYALENIQGKICLVNYTPNVQTLMGIVVPSRQGIPLYQHMTLDINDTTLMVYNV